MSIADELKKLADLRSNGTLTDAEFAQAKTATLAQLAPPATEPNVPGDKIGEHLAAVRYQNELERIDREWAIEREKYMMTGKNGRRYTPTVNESVIGAVVIGAIGVLWTIFALSITSSAPNFGGFGIAKVIFPLFGIVFTCVGIWTGVSSASKAEEYNRAQAAYQRRRAAVKPENFR